MTIAYASIFSRKEDILCGGRHQHLTNVWIQLMNALKETGCKIVFFSDSNVQPCKKSEWLDRKNFTRKIFTDLYKTISDGKTLKEILRDGLRFWRPLSSSFYNFVEIAKTHCDFNYSVEYECDVEIVQYANRHGAFAIITNDTDFLIFEGNWRLWFCHHIRIESNQVFIEEVNKNAIRNIYDLTPFQLPLFATLIGNDFTKPHYEKMTSFYETLGPLRYRYSNIVRFIKNEYGRSDDNIDYIERRVFGNAVQLKKLIRNSIDSYRIPEINKSNSIVAKSHYTNTYSYIRNIGTFHTINLQYYDIRGDGGDINLPNLLTNWLRRRKGVLGMKGAFTLLTQKDFNENYKAYRESVRRPNCEFDVQTDKHFTFVKCSTLPANSFRTHADYHTKLTFFAFFEVHKAVILDS